MTHWLEAYSYVSGYSHSATAGLMITVGHHTISGHLLGFPDSCLHDLKKCTLDQEANEEVLIQPLPMIVNLQRKYVWICENDKMIQMASWLKFEKGRSGMATSLKCELCIRYRENRKAARITAQLSSLGRRTSEPQHSKTMQNLRCTWRLVAHSREASLCQWPIMLL